MKKIANLILSLSFKFFPLILTSFFFFFFLKPIIPSFDNAKNFNNLIKAMAINEEYIILGSLYSKSNEPCLIYIL